MKHSVCKIVVHPSRLYGLHFMWQNLMGDNYMYAVVRASEESTELLGYSILFIGAVEFYLFAKQRTCMLARTIIPAPHQRPTGRTLTVSVSRPETHEELSLNVTNPNF